MSVSVKTVIEGSPAYKKGIKPGDNIVSINGHDIFDVLDYRFYADARILNIVLSDENGEREVRIKSVGGVDSLGLDFETYLMDKQHSCKNKCIFCFVDQLPKGLRKSLYFKDDDSRLSFLFGNYVTLTNMTEHEAQRIIDMHISPVNVSVHTMNPELRGKMMGNPNAGKSLDILKRFAAAGIKLNTQLVLCPGINDGDELVFSLTELAKLYPSVQSVAAVPVGLTRFREKLFPLTMYTRDTARGVIDIIDSFNEKMREKTGGNFAYAADEFYLKAELELPDYDYYGEFDQLDNGVGMWTLTRHDFNSALSTLDDDEIKAVGQRRIAVITGVAAAPLMKELADAIHLRCPDVTVDVYTIINDFFGHNITVAGLVTATDIFNQIKDLSAYDEAFIPSVMLKSEEEPIFLDDTPLCEAEKRLNVKITPTKCSGDDLLYTFLGI
ncbi:MAG: DUF512 domain-containing protein [Oscillospiraceae bacterium]|nr:DUF512 domain-containing protein [Oscillospiraceae bacterium]